MAARLPDAAASTVTVAGLWHQASVVAACLADLGYRVTGVGDDAAAVASLAAGRAPVFEPGLDDLLAANLRTGRLQFTTDYARALAGADVAFVCVDTPVDQNDDSDLTPVENAVQALADNASGPFVLCISAQVPIGTCHRLAAVVATRQKRFSIPVAYVPEFLRLGSAIQTFREADRFVVGADDRQVAERVAQLYRPLGRPVLITDVRSAEMGKHAANAFLATSISFINQIADLCDVTGADVGQVADILRLDCRIGPHAFLNAGLGYAGGTLGREIRTLQHLGARHGVPTALFEAVERVNGDRVAALHARLEAALDGLAGRRVGVLGLTYKPGTSTLRRSAALELIQRLVAGGAQVAAFDPLARLEEAADLPPFQRCDSAASAAAGASALVLIAPWQGLRASDLAALAPAMRFPLFVDTGNYLDAEVVQAAGLQYLGVGRGERLEEVRS